MSRHLRAIFQNKRRVATGTERLRASSLKLRGGSMTQQLNALARIIFSNKHMTTSQKGDSAVFRGISFLNAVYAIVVS
jgi:hypothetical protein